MDLMCSFHTIAFHGCLSARDFSKTVQCVKVSFSFCILLNEWESENRSRDTKAKHLISRVVFSIKINHYLLSPTHRENVRNSSYFVFPKHLRAATTNKVTVPMKHTTPCEAPAMKAASRTSVGSALSEMVHHEMEK